MVCRIMVNLNPVLLVFRTTEVIYGLEILKSKNYNFKNMKKRDFLKTSATLASTALLPSSLMALKKTSERLRTAHVGVGNMGAADLASIASHESVDVVALCDVD